MKFSDLCSNDAFFARVDGDPGVRMPAERLGSSSTSSRRAFWETTAMILSFPQSLKIKQSKSSTTEDYW